MHWTLLYYYNNAVMALSLLHHPIPPLRQPISARTVQYLIDWPCDEDNVKLDIHDGQKNPLVDFTGTYIVLINFCHVIFPNSKMTIFVSPWNVFLTTVTFV